MPPTLPQAHISGGIEPSIEALSRRLVRSNMPDTASRGSQIQTNQPEDFNIE